MKANNIVRGFTACLISLCLSGWSFVASATAATIVVTTTADVVDPPFNTGSLCGSGGTVADLPGADGKVSLREAIIAANNTPGQKTIIFAPSLNGATIVTTAPLFLCGGHITLNGDVNGDETPDVTLDGTAVSIHDVIDISSSHNTVKNLQVLVPSQSFYIPAGISIGNNLGTDVMDNTITHNSVSGPIHVTEGINSTNEQSLHGVNIKHTVVRDNTMSSVRITIYGENNSMTALTIAHNTVSGATGPGILVLGGQQNFFDPNDHGAIDNRLDITIKENTVTGNNNPGDTAGVAILGGLLSSSNTQATAQLLNNTITNNNGSGISVGSGLDNSSNNHVDVYIRGNMLENNVGVGILTYGAIGAAFSPAGDSSGNSLNARIELNTVKNALVFGIWVNGGIGSFDGAPNKVANGNAVNAVVTDNTVTGTLFGEGIHLEAGGSGEANDNDVDVTIRKNTVCGSALVDIDAVGGLLGNPFLPNNNGTGNALEGEITKNTASTVVVENGVAGNTTQVTQFKNAPCP